MSYYYIAAIAVAACFILLVYNIISQIVEQKRRATRRFSVALQRRLSDLQELNCGIPKGLLSNELQIFLLDEQIAAQQRLCKLKPKDSQLISELHRLQQQRQEAPKKSQQRLKLTNSQEISLAKSQLDFIGTILTDRISKKILFGSQAKSLQKDHQQAAFQVKLVSFQHAAKQAEKNENFSVAIHFYEQAKKLLMGSENGHLYKTQISTLENHLQTLIQNHQHGTPEIDELPPQSLVEPQQLPEKEYWQKKQVYD